MSAIYRIITLGDEATGIPPRVKSKIVEIAKTLGIEDGVQLEFVDGANAVPTTAACVAVFMGATPCPAFAQHALLAAGIPVIPLVSDKTKCLI